MERKKVIKIVSVIIALVMIIGILSQAFVMTSFAHENTSKEVSSLNDSTSDSVNNSQPIPPSTDNIVLDTASTAFIQNYVVMDMNGNELTNVTPGQKIKIAISVVDSRVLYLNNPPAQIRARMSQGAFFNNDINNVSYKVKDAGKRDGRNILSYTIVFHDVTYNGGTPDMSFDISYIEIQNGQEVSLAVPYTLLTQNITQAADNVPEPKVILNSANYGDAAYVGKNFVLNTVATNTSEYLSLDNVSVKVELPSGIAMASGNSQVLIGKIAPKGTINQSFSLIVTGVENNVTSLPIKLTYEYEAYVKGERKTYTTTNDVAINIEQETVFDVTKLEYLETANVGEETSVSVHFLNKGKTTVNNVVAELRSDALDGPQTVFVGNIQPGTENVSDIYFTPNKEGKISGKVVITYEDTKGKQSTIEKDFSIEALEVDNESFMVGPTEPMQPEKKSKLPIILTVIGVSAVLVVCGVVIYKKRKAKQELEVEDEDI